MFKIGWFSTGRGQGSLNLLNAIVNAVNKGTVNAEIAYVFCSRDQGDARGSDNYITQIKNYGLKLFTFSSKKFKPELRNRGNEHPEILKRWRLEYDREIMKLIDGTTADIIVLAGYMLIVSPEMCERYSMINLHPAEPNGPAGTWQEVIWKLIETRSEHSGNMMHLVTKELDKGSPISYCTFSLKGDAFESLWGDLDEALRKKSIKEIIKEEGEDSPLFLKIRQESAKREIPLVIQTVKAFADGRLRLEENKIIADGKVLQGPYCLTEEIEKQIKVL